MAKQPRSLSHRRRTKHPHKTKKRLAIKAEMLAKKKKRK